MVVPLYNEVHRLPDVASEFGSFIANAAAGSELVFVDDGSEDGTSELVQDLFPNGGAPRVRLLKLGHRGKGAAVRAGLESATTDLAGFCDLDLSTPLIDFSKVVTAALEMPVLAIGSRSLPTSQLTRRQSVRRELSGWLFNRAVRSLLGVQITDTQCGAKAARTTVWQRVLPLCREQGYAWDVEVIALAERLGISVQEVAIEWRHKPGSRVRVFRDGLAMYRALARIKKNVGRAEVTRSASLKPHAV